MMPIRPENRARYPADWKQISRAIRARAGNRCEGSPAYPDCRAENGVTGYWRNGLYHRLPEVLRHAGYSAGDRVACANGETLKIIKIVLTVAHLDHTPENTAPSNLRAMCQRCHLTYDAKHHARTAYATRRAAARTPDMFDDEGGALCST